MKKNSLSIVIVPHDVSKTRTYSVSYGTFYLCAVFLALGAVALVLFLATYGNLLLRAREAAGLERQVEELTAQTEQVAELRRRLVELQAMELKVRRMLGLEAAATDSLGQPVPHIGEEVGEMRIGGETEQILRAIPSFWPVRGYITRGFGAVSTAPGVEFHAGIDIAVSRGTPVRAAASGYVSEAGWDDVYGYFVRIDHGYGIKTMYGHNDRLVVLQGERVGRGQTIAYSGSTGRSTAPHLHFEVTRDNVHEDPLKYLLR